MLNDFSIKSIRLDITLGKGNFANGGKQKSIEGLACEVSVEKPGLPERGSASIKLWGLSYDDMSELTMLSFRPLQHNHNLISIKAGEKGGTLSQIFYGEISEAFADFNAAPDVAMSFWATSGSHPQKISAPHLTVTGEAQAEQLFEQFAYESGYSFRNMGVTGGVQNFWFHGSPIEKATKLADDIGCELIIDDGTLIIMPEGEARQGHTVFLSKNTGLIGYPTFNSNGISCRCIFDPNLQYGGLIQVKSIVPRASGTWRISKLSHNLSAYCPNGGNWESQIEASFVQ